MKLFGQNCFLFVVNIKKVSSEIVTTHHIFPVDDPVGRDVSVALHSPGEVELVAVDTLWLTGYLGIVRSP